MATMITGARQLPLAHISVRVPWHDAGWNGTVCQNPSNNIACLILKRTRQERDDKLEESIAGRRWDELPVDQLPPCAAERASFMAPFEFTRTIEHPYVQYRSPLYQDFALTPYRHAAYSAACVPFRWMRRDFVEGTKTDASIADSMGIGYRPELEPSAEELGFNSGWLQHHENQRVMLDTFFSAIKPEESLCIFYAKRTPLSEDTRRVIIGIGRVTHVGAPVEYNRTSDRWRSNLWERNVQHSVRPGFKDGFILPYRELLDEASRDTSINPEDYVAFAPEGYWDAFSYGSEHVSHDGAIASLLAAERALRKMADVIPGDWDTPLQWISNELGRLWEMRGPFPGLGAALTAFGIPHGNLVAYEIALAQESGKVEWNEDPWPLVELALNDPALLPETGHNLSTNHLKMWNQMLPERKALLQLLSRFDISVDQATRFYQERQKAGLDVTEEELLANPYLLYELDRHRLDGIGVTTIDRGLFPDPIVRSKHPIPEPSALDGELDERRVRALVVHTLEAASANGHSLQSRDSVIQAIRDMELKPECPVSIDLMPVVESTFSPVVDLVMMANDDVAYQLGRLSEMREIIRSAVEKRLKGRPHAGEYDWRAMLDAVLQPAESSLDREQEERAREEKTAALRTLYTSRISVLIGPAGTGKTTLLKVLCNSPGINGDVLLLAPTGKARVRMETQIGITGAKTIAQFLFPHRYDGETGIYRLSDAEKQDRVNTVIIDEASMLTEEQLAAVIDALKPPERLILVGDPRQLPPIGTGRPFLDIVRRLSPPDVEAIFPKVGLGYAELSVQRRQTGDIRPDMQLAQWFSGQEPGAGTDELWYHTAADYSSDYLRLVPWNDDEELEEKFLQVLVEELGLEGIDDETGFELSLGGVENNGYIYFNYGRTARKAEAWQVLSPVRGDAHGVTALNRLLQERFRRTTKDWASSSGWNVKIPRPMGNESIIYGDKVINTINRSRQWVYPKDGALKYVANGEIGVVVGQFKPKKWNGRPQKLEVEFSSQPGYKYDFLPWEFSEEASPVLELAYALTVHKTQGSEFGITFIVLPNPCRLLSRELLYTAFTRQKDKLVIFYQGAFSELRRFSTDDESEIARRVTNLFDPPAPIRVVKEDREFYLEEGLIHRTVRGERVRSKSEVIIADRLDAHGLDYEYEAELINNEDGSRRLPDFTIYDAELGQKVFWEHLGMFQDPAYRQRWERKLEWYRKQDILEAEYGGGPAGTLVITYDDEQGGIDAQAIDQIIREVFGE